MPRYRGIISYKIKTNKKRAGLNVKENHEKSTSISKRF